VAFLLGDLACSLGGGRQDGGALLRREQSAVRGVPGRIPASAQPRQRQVGRQLAATEPHRTACAINVAPQRDGKASDLSGVTGAEPPADQNPGVFQPVKELSLA
jgi:hypothetical protein